MQYDDLQKLYPFIQAIFSQVADYVHDIGPEMALGWAQKYGCRHIAPEHREAVIAKIRLFIDSIKEANDGEYNCNSQTQDRTFDNWGNTKSK